MFNLREISVTDGGLHWAAPARDGKPPKPALFHRGHQTRGARSVYLSAFCPKGHSVFIGRACAEAEAVSDWIGRMGAGLLRISRDCLASTWVARRAETLDFVIVDAGAFGCSDELRRLCEALRRLVPSVPVVLMPSASGETPDMPGVARCADTSEAGFVRALRAARACCEPSSTAVV